MRNKRKPVALDLVLHPEVFHADALVHVDQKADSASQISNSKGALYRFAPFVLFLIIAALCAFPLLKGADPSAPSSPLIGKPAPRINLPPALNGMEGFETENLRGKKPILVNFFASWCGSCRGEQAVLEKIYTSEDILIFGVDLKDQPKALEIFLAETGNPFDAVVADKDGRAAIDWGTTGVPETFLIDREGIVRYQHTGPLTEDVWTRSFLPLVEAMK